MTTPDQPCHLAGMHPADCPAYVAGIASLRARLRAAAAWPDATGHADMRIEVVKRELNQGALAGFDSAVTDYAARLVIAALDSYEASALQLTYERGVAEGLRLAEETAQKALDKAGKVMWDGGVAEGRRQATEGFDHLWGVGLSGTPHVIHCRDESHARGVAVDLAGGHHVVSRLVGPWEPAEQGGDDRG